MNTMQRGDLKQCSHRCIVAYTSLFLLFAGLGKGTSSLAQEEKRNLHDFAEVFVNQYFEPEESLLLSSEGKKKSQALANFSLGRSYEAKGRVLEAIDAYRKVLANDPGQHFLARKTAYLLARNGGVEDAMKILEDNLKNNPEQPFSHIALSEFLSTYQGNEAAGRARSIDIAKGAVEKFPTVPAVYEHLVRLYMTAQQRDEAYAVMESSLQQDSKDPRFWLRMGKIAGQVWAAERQGDTPDGLVNELFEKALSTAGSDKQVVEEVADFFHATGNLDRAIASYVDVIQAHPDRLEVRQKLASVYAAKEDLEKVIQTLKEILEIDPDHEPSHRTLAQIYIGEDDYLSAIPHLRRALALSEGGASEYGTLARVMIQAEQDEAAAEFLEEAITLFPEVPDFPFLSTFPLGRMERWEESIKRFELTIQVAGDENPQMLDESFYFRYAAAVERNGDLEKAEKLFKKTIEMITESDPSEQDDEFTATVYNYLGYMWLENDLNVDEAGELIKTASDLAPESGAIADSLGWFYFKKGRFEEAKTELLRAEQLIEEQDAVIFDHIARVFYELGDKEPALDYMKKALELEPENKEYQERFKIFEKGEKDPSAPDLKKAEPEKASPGAPEKPEANPEEKKAA